MKRFVFRLETYLNQTRRQEEAERFRLAALIQEEARLSQIRRELVHRREEQQSRLARSPALAAYEASWYVHHIYGLGRQIDELEHRLKTCREEIERQRQALVEARRRLRPVEKLKQRRQDAWQQEADKWLQREVEDLHLQRVARQERGPWRTDPGGSGAGNRERPDTSSGTGQCRLPNPDP
jgi:flagellar export protein FliJ